MYLNSDAILSHPDLDFESMVMRKTGEHAPNWVAKNWHLTFTYRDGSKTKPGQPSLKIQGSLHKASNAIQRRYLNHKKGYNGDDFRHSQVVETLEFLSDHLKLNLQRAKLTSVEIGVNLIVPVKPVHILDGLLMHKGAQFTSSKGFPYREAVHFQYRAKIYDKGTHYRDHNRKLRIEIHYNKLEQPKGHGLVFISDLMDKAVISRFKRVLVSMWQRITFFDYSIDRGLLNDHGKRQFDLLSNPIYWKQLQPNRRDRPRERLKVLEQHHSDGIKKKVEQLIESKFDEMCNT